MSGIQSGDADSGREGGFAGLPPAAAGVPAAVHDARYEEFLAHFARTQGRVQGLIFSLVHDRTSAEDVFQATCLALWRKFGTFRGGGEFAPWALGVARKEVLMYWRSRRRDRLVFSEAVLSQLADASLELAEDGDPRQEALQACIQKLPERQRQLVALFYGQGLPAEAIAAAWQRSVHAVYKALKVMRLNLTICIDRTLSEGPSSTPAPR